MAHLHSVYDNDTHFKIDTITREIENTSGKAKLMQFDHKSERFTFEIPRFNGMDGHDMSLCNKVNVHYINIDAKTKAQNVDIYPVTDLQISPDSDDVVICSWEITQNATMYAGTLNFIVAYTCVDDEGKLDYRWATEIYKGYEIGEGYNNSNAIVEEYSDILAEWEARIAALEKSGVSDEQIASAVAAYLTENPIESGITEESDPTVPDWAKQSTKPTYTAEEVGADSSGTAEKAISAHNTSEESHNDIRLLIDALTTSKVSVSDIIDNLVTSEANKPLSANQGVELKTLIDNVAADIPTDEHINDLINTALGVIENGTY